MAHKFALAGLKFKHLGTAMATATILHEAIEKSWGKKSRTANQSTSHKFVKWATVRRELRAPSGDEDKRLTLPEGEPSPQLLATTTIGRRRVVRTKYDQLF